MTDLVNGSYAYLADYQAACKEASSEDLIAAKEFFRANPDRNKGKLRHVNIEINRRRQQAITVHKMTKPPKGKDVSTARIRIMHQQGLTNEQMAEYCGVDINVINKAVKAAGLRPREYKPPEPHIWAGIGTVQIWPEK